MFVKGPVTFVIVLSEHGFILTFGEIFRRMSVCLLVELLISMAEKDVNRFWKRKTWIRVIPGQITNPVGPKQEFELLWKDVKNLCSDRTQFLKRKIL